MRKLIFLLLLAAAGSSAAADFANWQMVDHTEAFVVYADTGTIRRFGELAQMWDLSDAKEGKALAPVKGSKSFKAEREYDCSKQQLRLLYISWFSGNMGEGSIVGSDSSVKPWQPVLVGTIGERLWNIACGVQQGRRF